MTDKGHPFRYRLHFKTPQGNGHHDIQTDRVPPAGDWDRIKADTVDFLASKGVRDAVITDVTMLIEAR